MTSIERTRYVFKENDMTYVEGQGMKRNSKTFLLIMLAFTMLSPKVLADNDGTASSDNAYVFSGTTVVNTGKDNGFSKRYPIDKDDPHYGWSLGDFYVTGFTSYNIEQDGTVVFLKNAGDKVTLSFDLQQSKTMLNGDDDLELHYDTKAYDEYFQTKVYQHSMGLLIMQKTDYQNKKEDPIIFESFLEDAKQKSDKEVQLCEEGDYEVALDYEIEVDGSYFGILDKDTYEDYRISFNFKVRNGNCMIFPRDLAGNELTNESYSQDGFFIDFAKSRYLRINVKYMVLVEGQNGLVEDVRYNRPAADGEQYTQSGIYEIDIENLYTSQTMTKTIYVGDDPVIKMLAIEGKSLEDVNKELYPEETTTVETEPEETETPGTTETTLSPTETTVPQLETSAKTQSKDGSDDKDSSGNGNKMIVAICAIGAVIVVAAGAIVIPKLLKRKKSSETAANGDAKPTAPTTSPAETKNDENTAQINMARPSSITTETTYGGKSLGKTVAWTPENKKPSDVPSESGNDADKDEKGE